MDCPALTTIFKHLLVNTDKCAIITGIYVRRANNEFDALKQELIEESK